MHKQDYYELLGVERNAAAGDIKAAYRKKAFQFHPDRNAGDSKSEEMFKLVAEAYDVLSDERKRGIYDQFGHAGLQGGGYGFGHGFASTDDIFASFGDIFEDFFGVSTGAHSRGRTRARRGQDIEAQVEIDFLESCAGVKKEVTVSHHVHCETCKGSGAEAGREPERCGYCNGHGQVRMTQGFFTISTTCPQCSGTGHIIRAKCPKCRGSGVVVREHKLTVKVPPGVSDGMRLLMHGEGEAGLHGGPNGDLYVYLRVKKHAEFAREEDNIISRLKINFSDLALGCAPEVNTIDGTETVTIKPGTQSGEVIVLKGKGVPNVRSGRRGNQLVYIQAVTPTELTDRQRELLGQLSREFGEGAGAAHEKKKKKKGFFG